MGGPYEYMVYLKNISTPGLRLIEAGQFQIEYKTYGPGYEHERKSWVWKSWDWSP